MLSIGGWRIVATTLKMFYNKISFCFMNRKPKPTQELSATLNTILHHFPFFYFLIPLRHCTYSQSIYGHGIKQTSVRLSYCPFFTGNDLFGNPHGIRSTSPGNRPASSARFIWWQRCSPPFCEGGAQGVPHHRRRHCTATATKS